MEDYPSSDGVEKNVSPNKEVQPKGKGPTMKSYDKEPVQGRMRSCGPPQILGVETPPWSHPLPSHLPPMFHPSPSGRHFRMETPRVRSPASNTRSTYPPINVLPDATWTNTDRDQRNVVPTIPIPNVYNPMMALRAWYLASSNWPAPLPMNMRPMNTMSMIMMPMNMMSPYPGYSLGPSLGVAPCQRPLVLNNWQTPTPINIVPNIWPTTNMGHMDQANGVLVVQNPSAGNLLRSMPGVAPRPLPSTSNTWLSPSPMIVVPNTWPNAIMDYTGQANGIPTLQNPNAGNVMGPMSGMAHWLPPSVSNTWLTPLSMNAVPNTWPNTEICYTGQRNCVPAAQNAHPSSAIGPHVPVSVQVQHLLPYPTGL